MMTPMKTALAVLAAATLAHAAEVNVKKPSDSVAELVTFAAPTAGWHPVEYANSGGVDPVLRFERLSDAIVVKAYGGPGSAYKTPEDFLKGPAATSSGAAPESVGTVEVAGKKAKLWRRRFHVDLPDPHGPPAPVMMGSETFLVLPASGKRFVVLSKVRESPAPDLEDVGGKAWEAFLKTVKMGSAKKSAGPSKKAAEPAKKK